MTGKRVSGSNATFVWADAELHSEERTDGERRDSDLAAADGPASPAHCSSARRAPSQQGLRFRDLDTTVRDTLDWNNKRPAEQREKLAVGLTPEREAELLKLLAAKKG